MRVPDRCGHCGREGTLRRVDSVVTDRQDATENEGEAEYQRVVQIDRCERCSEPTFSVYGWVEAFFDEPDDAIDHHVIYPTPRDTDDLPDRVRERYESMLQLAYEPDAFAVRAGRVLEAVCADQGATGRDLYKRLEALVAGNTLPKALGEQAHLVRDYRNLGGHDSEVEPEAEDVPLIRDFVESVLDFLYWGPAKHARGLADLRARQHAEKGGRGS